MKFFIQISILGVINIALLGNCGQFVIDASDTDLSQHHGLFLSGFENVPPGNAELAQIPSLENLSQMPLFSNFSANNAFGRLCIVYNLQSLDDSTLDLLFQQVSILQNRRSTWAPTILAQFPQENKNALQILETFVDKRVSAWNFPINEGFYVTFRNTNSADPLPVWNIFEVYSIKNITIVQTVEREPFTLTQENNGLNYYTLLKKDARRSDFRKVVMVGLGMDTHGYELATDFDDDNSTDRFISGFEVKIYRYLMDALNFTEKALRGTAYVREGPGKTLTGMAVPINQGKADICISSTEFLEYRISGPDGFPYLLPTFNLGMKAYFKQPGASSIRDVFTSAFSLQLWVSLLGLWVFICLSMHLAYFIYFRDEWYKELSWKDVVMSDEISIWATGALCQQGWYFTPSFIGTRIIFFFGWFTGFLCYIAYSAQLVSILSVEVVPIKSFEDLIRDQFFLHNDNHIPTTKYFLKGLEERGIIRPVPEQLRNVDIEQTILKIIKTKSAMISIPDSLFPILTTMGLSNEFICSEISDVGMGGRSVIMSMFVKRANPIRGIFNTKILQMIERGVNHRILQDYFLTTSVQCLKGGGSGQNIPLSSKDVFTAYAILLSGFFLSSTIVMVEQLFHRRTWIKTKLRGAPDFALSADSAMQLEYVEPNSNKSGNDPSTNVFDLYTMTRKNNESLGGGGVKKKSDKFGSWAKFRF